MQGSITSEVLEWVCLKIGYPQFQWNIMDYHHLSYLSVYLWVSPIFNQTGMAWRHETNKIECSKQNPPMDWFIEDFTRKLYV